MKKIVVLSLILGVLIAAGVYCYMYNTPDAVETFGEKREWSILQSIEASNRSNLINEPKFMIAYGYEVIGLKDNDGKNVWIMLKPESPPYYKQMPPDVNYLIQKNLVDQMVREQRLGYTTMMVLRSHETP
jgi:hypothetical protein